MRSASRHDKQYIYICHIPPLAIIVIVIIAVLKDMNQLSAHLSVHMVMEMNETNNPNKNRPKQKQVVIFGTRSSNNKARTANRMERETLGPLGGTNTTHKIE